MNDNGADRARHPFIRRSADSLPPARALIEVAADAECAPCPYCDGEHTHLCGVQVDSGDGTVLSFLRGEDGTNGIVRGPLVPSVNYGRGSAVGIWRSCEECGAQWLDVLAFHKGTTERFTARVVSRSTPHELWRD